jgi:hypothetical protein
VREVQRQEFENRPDIEIDELGADPFSFSMHKAAPAVDVWRTTHLMISAHPGNGRRRSQSRQRARATVAPS